MSNIKNNIEFEGMKVENAVQKIIEYSTNAVFIVECTIRNWKRIIKRAWL